MSAEPSKIEQLNADLRSHLPARPAHAKFKIETRRVYSSSLLIYEAVLCVVFWSGTLRDFPVCKEFSAPDEIKERAEDKAIEQLWYSVSVGDQQAFKLCGTAACNLCAYLVAERVTALKERVRYLETEQQAARTQLAELEAAAKK